jgi:DNA-binding NarL/FixJ family response regulator
MRNPAVPHTPRHNPSASRDKDIAVLVIDPSPLGRSCTLAVLDHAVGLRARGTSDIAGTPEGEKPDLLLFQGFRAGPGNASRAAQLTDAASRWPDAAMIVMADGDETDDVLDSLRHGARGFLTSDVGLDLLVEAIHVVRRDLMVYPSHILQVVRDALAGSGSARTDKGNIDHRRFHGLTPRQQDVLRLLALGLSNKLIARQLLISESTVKVHIRAIMEQAGARNRTQIIAHFLGQNSLPEKMDLPS